MRCAFFDENFITNFAKTHTKKARTIKDWFNRLVARIRQAMDKVKKYVTEYRAISDDVAEVERIRDLFNAALDERNANVKLNNEKEINGNIQHSDKLFKNALTSSEWKKYNNAMTTGIDAGIRISDNSILVKCENNSQWQYKYVIYDDYSDRNEISDVFAIGKIDNNVEDDVAFQCNEIAVYINDVKELGYDNKSYFKKILRTRLKDTSYILSQYNNKSERYNVIGRGSIENGTNTVDKPNGRGILTADSRNLKFSVKQPIEETKDLIAIMKAEKQEVITILVISHPI